MRWCCASMKKSQIQALNRTQPVLPMGLGYVEGVTHDYVRHGTTTLFAALDIATGAVFTECKPRHRHQEFLSFLRRLDASIPEELDVHHHRRQLRHPQTPQGAHLAGATAPLPHSLHPDLLILAQSGGALVRSHAAAPFGVPAKNAADVVVDGTRLKFHPQEG